MGMKNLCLIIFIIVWYLQQYLLKPASAESRNMVLIVPGIVDQFYIHFLWFKRVIFCPSWSFSVSSIFFHYSSSSLSLSSSPGWMKNTMRVMSSLSVSFWTDTTVSLVEYYFRNWPHYNYKYWVSPDFVPEALASHKSSLSPLL